MKPYHTPKSERDNAAADLDQAEQIAELAPESCACPKCGERRMDSLIWNDDDRLACASCGLTYDPIAEPVTAQLRAWALEAADRLEWERAAILLALAIDRHPGNTAHASVRHDLSTMATRLEGYRKAALRALRDQYPDAHRVPGLGWAGPGWEALEAAERALISRLDA